MIRKGNFIKNTAVALAIISVFGSTLSSVSAAEILSSTPAITQYVDGSYNVDLSILKEGTQEASSLARYYNSAKIEVSNNKMYMTINFNSDPMIQALQPKVNGEAVTDLDDSLTTVKFEISSLEDNISLYIEINTGTAYGVMKHTCDVRIDNAEIPTQAVETSEDISITLKHLTEDKTSSGNNFLQSSKLKTVNGKKYIVMTFKSGSMFTAMQVSINNKDVETTLTKNEADNTATVEFEVSSLADYMELSFSYDTGSAYGVMTHSARIQTSENVNAVKPEDKEEDKEEDDAITSPTPGTGSDSNTGSGSTTDTYKNGYYQLKNVVHSDSTTGYNMVRGILSETTNMEVKDGKIYMTIKMGSYSLMGDISVKVNGTTTTFTKNVVDSDTVELTFEVPSVDAKVTMGMYISAMGKSVDFDLTFNKETVSFISSNEEPTIPNAGGSSTSGSTSGTTSGSTTTESTTTETLKGKLYTIQNQIVSDNATGKEMARKYLNSTTKIEEVDGKMYATLTFTGVDLMSNHKIYVNGSLVNYTVTASSSSSKSIRFEIPNVNADIKVQVYVVPMGSTVTFGVKLLEDTLTFVKEYDVEEGSLPQTGSVVNSETMVAAGGLLTMAGALLRRKRK